MPDEWREFVLCREMGWTHEEYENQPGYLNDWFLAFMSEEARVRKRAAE